MTKFEPLSTFLIFCVYVDLCRYGIIVIARHTLDKPIFYGHKYNNI